ncbi:unnamed protein product [Darwinula stevensoni]|uniref:Cytochrome b-c1 complex subunit 7 n=1 Tax=Darwinula stevensoni TaxID=69355 RepID=A0A7R8XM07_9CRUS|nr:unnamed protein product [Darwinula stevensoni]CAG0894949.1 unnamed protein product [Darwinula stevensoni]
MSSDDFRVCPYDPHHVVSARRYLVHLIKCGEKSPVVLEECPFNAQHRIKPEEVQEHLENCPDRRIVDSSKLPKQRGLGCTVVPPYVGLYEPIKSHEAWDMPASSSGRAVWRNPIKPDSKHSESSDEGDSDEEDPPMSVGRGRSKKVPLGQILPREPHSEYTPAHAFRVAQEGSPKMLGIKKENLKVEDWNGWSSTGDSSSDHLKRPGLIGGTEGCKGAGVSCVDSAAGRTSQGSEGEGIAVNDVAGVVRVDGSSLNITSSAGMDEFPASSASAVSKKLDASEDGASNSPHLSDGGPDVWLPNLLMGRGRGMISSSRDHVRKPTPVITPLDRGGAASSHPPPEASHLPGSVADPSSTSNTLGEMTRWLKRFAYNTSGFRKYGLRYDDCLYETAEVKEAISRLPLYLQDERAWRISRALHLNLRKDILPKDQWTKYEEESKIDMFTRAGNTTKNKGPKSDLGPCTPAVGSLKEARGPRTARAIPGGTEAMPGGAEAMPGGAEAMPGGTEAMPGGAEAMPGGTEAMPGGRGVVKTVRVEVVSGTPLVWDPEDASYLRAEWRIVGELLGSYPARPFQNAVKSVPMKLSNEEMTLLLEKGVAVPVRYPSLKESPSAETRERLERLRGDAYWEQARYLHEERRKEIEQNAEKIIEGKRKKLEERRSRRGGGEEDEVEEDLDEEACIQAELDKIQLIPRRTALVQGFKGDPWVSDGDAAASEWTFPSTEAEERGYRVFRHLWEGGCYLTDGAKFGGDFLVYPGRCEGSADGHPERPTGVEGRNDVAVRVAIESRTNARDVPTEELACRGERGIVACLCCWLWGIQERGLEGGGRPLLSRLPWPPVASREVERRPKAAITCAMIVGIPIAGDRISLFRRVNRG